ncbi:MAG: hypothetical protein H6R27_387 [Proteobacteria bacterium]|nr:hypothetical protein [Pseudomonadota bacterium]
MCLLVVALDAHPDYRLVMVGHRDEFHARPAAPLGWWADEPDILAGRDLAAGGTWLGIGRDGRVGVVTNVRGADALVAGAPSRGALVPGFLSAGTPAPDHAATLTAGSAAYSGFNLLTFDGSCLSYVTNRPVAEAETLAAGLYGLSNARLDSPWPKVELARQRVADVLAGGRVVPESLFAAIDDRQPAPDAELPDTGIGLEWERLLSAPFIVSPDYGTRCTTLVLAGRDGGIRVEERRYSPSGETTGRTVIAFHTSRPGYLGG